MEAAETDHHRQAFVYCDAFIAVDEFCSDLPFGCHHPPPSSCAWEGADGVDWRTERAEQHCSNQCLDKEDFPEHLYVSAFGKQAFKLLCQQELNTTHKESCNSLWMTRFFLIFECDLCHFYVSCWDSQWVSRTLLTTSRLCDEQNTLGKKETSISYASLLNWERC